MKKVFVALLSIAMLIGSVPFPNIVNAQSSDDKNFKNESNQMRTDLTFVKQEKDYLEYTYMQDGDYYKNTETIVDKKEISSLSFVEGFISNLLFSKFITSSGASTAPLSILDK